METRKNFISPTATKEYLTQNNIPQLFECLMTGLMYHRPVDHLHYLQDCLEKIKRQGIAGVRWDLFLETRKAPTSVTEAKAEGRNLSKYDPQPGIDSLRLKIRSNASVICVLAGPGVEKSSYSRGLLVHYPTFVHICMGDLLRNRAKLEAQRENSYWVTSAAGINSGELVPTAMATESLIWNMNQHADANGFIIDGFPRTEQQYDELKSHVGMERLACIFLIDAAEEFCRQQLADRAPADDYWTDNQGEAVERRICVFKNQTLPMCKLVDTDGKLRVVDGEIKTEHIARDMRTACEYVLSGKVTGPASRPTPGSVPEKPLSRVNHSMTGCPGQPPIFNIPRIVPTFVDKGRVADLFTAPVILLFGGPGSGRTEQANTLCEQLSGLKHFNITDFLRKRVLDKLDEDSQKDWDVVARRVHSSDPPMSRDRIVPEYWDVQVDILRQEFNTVAENARAVVIEGFPNDENQLNTFNQHVGGADLAILLDCEEATLNKRLLKRFNRISRNEDEESVALQRVIFFKHCTLPVVRHYDERSKLVTIPGDRSVELVLGDLMTVVEYFLAKHEANTNNTVLNETSERKTSQFNNNNAVLHDRSSSDSNPECETSIQEARSEPVETEVATLQHSLDIKSNAIEQDASEYHSHASVNADNEIAGGDVEPEPNIKDLEDIKVVFVLGPPGCGKTTQCGMLVEKFGFKHINLEYLLKQIAEEKQLEKTDFDTETLVEMLKIELTTGRKNAEWILLDGFPRNLQDAVVFEKTLVPCHRVLVIETGSDILVDHLQSKSSDDGVDLEHKLWKQHCEHYKETIPHLLNHYELTEKLIRIASGSPVDVVFSQICSALEPI